MAAPSSRALLRRPGLNHLEGWRAALERGWEPSTTDGSLGAKQRAQMAEDPAGFVAAQHGPEGGGPPVSLPDGTLVPRLPFMRRVVWDGGFAGLVDLRWQQGFAPLPATCLGHLGYSVVPWRRGEGLATRAVAEIAAEARLLGMPHVDAAIHPGNPASARVMEKCGASCVGQQSPGAAYGHQSYDLWRISL